MATKYRYVRTTADKIPEGVRFDTPRQNQGQIVEVQYGTHSRYEAGPGDPWKKVVDRSLGIGELGRVEYFRLVTDAEG